MKIVCKSCNQEYEVDDSFKGKQAQCNCGALIDVPTDKPKKNFWRDPEYLPGFKVPFEARVFFILKFLAAFHGVLCLISAIGGSCSGRHDADRFWIIFASEVVAFLMLSVAQKTITYLAEIAYNSRKK